MDDRAVVTMSGSELLSACDVIEDAIEKLLARRNQILQRLDEIDYAQEIGAHDTARLLEKRYRLDPAEARRRVRLATALPKYPTVAAALPTPGNPTDNDDNGDGHGGDGGAVVLSSAQADAIVSALEKLPKSADVPVEELDAAAEQMVQAARHMKPGDLRRMGEQVRNILDTDGPEPREDAARAREEVWIKKAEHGVKFGGYLAGENAEKLQTVLQAGAKPHKTEDGEHDPRSRGKRQADALVDALDIALASGDLPTRGGIKPHIAVTINLNDLLEAGRQATGDLTYGDGLSAAAIRRLACDAGIIPIVLGSDSQPLDVGREFRYVTTGLRNALNQRDRGCVICHAPPIYCDAHHLVSWFDGGVTSLANMVLLCRVDHTSLHDGHWTIRIVDNQVHVTRPTWADPPPRTGRRLDQPSTTAATAPATSATHPWPPPTAAAPPTTTNADPWPPSPAATDTAPWTSASPGTSADPWMGADPRMEAAPWTSGDPWIGADSRMGADTRHSLSEAVADGGADSRAATAPVRSEVSVPAPGSAQVPGPNWPYDDDAAWITAEETAALDPWGGNPGGIGTPPAGPEQTATRARHGLTNAPWTTPEEAAVLDPWGDRPGGAVA
ncbi:DUF222 domain-containing protein [Kribbella sp. NPDC051718]|uniref:HNH endonuclease signature motif containing protein n=1 Tax=Kribbella sp. NPDC051718 TaxID=3155168 RepID=UPI003446EDFF